MIWNSLIEGKYVTLRSVTEGDAKITTELRQNPEKVKFLHPVSADVEKQREWIKRQIHTEGDYFFLVLDKNDKPIGTMGISEIQEDKGYTGRLLMYGNAFQSYEAYMLLIDFGFKELGLIEQHGETDIENVSAMKFSKMFGFKYGEPTYDPKMDRQKCDCTLSPDDFEVAKMRLMKMIYR